MHATQAALTGRRTGALKRAYDASSYRSNTQPPRHFRAIDIVASPSPSTSAHRPTLSESTRSTTCCQLIPCTQGLVLVACACQILYDNGTLAEWPAGGARSISRGWRRARLAIETWHARMTSPPRYSSSVARKPGIFVGFEQGRCGQARGSQERDGAGR